MTVWNIAKWPVLVVVVMTMIAFLYYVAPNVQQPGFRWVTPGSVIAVVVWLVASLGFGLYVRFFGSYNQTYGTLAGVVIFLVWLWVTNLRDPLRRGVQRRAGTRPRAVRGDPGRR